MRETIGHYRVLDTLGSGGIGDVYRGRDTKLGRTVAIKAVDAKIATDPDRRAELLNDARATARLSHPNIAALYEIIEDGPDLFLVFDYAGGESLTTMLGGHALNPRRAVDLAVQIADALADAHAEGVVHGDLKPDNIVVTPRGNAKLLEFGLFRWTRGGAARRAAATITPTDPATVLGTLAYLSPEQAVGEGGDARSDIFSLGVILFQMLTGKLPFSGSTAEDMVLHIAQARPPAVTSLNANLPAELDPIVARALSKSLADRYETAASLAAELRTVSAILDVRATVAAEQPRTVVTTGQSNRSGFWIFVVVVLALIAAAAWWVLRGTV